MKTFLGFGHEKELFLKAINFIQNPSKFYKKNKDKEEKLLDFLTFTIRFSIIIDFLFTCSLE